MFGIEPFWSHSISFHYTENPMWFRSGFIYSNIIARLFDFYAENFLTAFYIYVTFENWLMAAGHFFFSFARINSIFRVVVRLMTTIRVEIHIYIVIRFSFFFSECESFGFEPIKRIVNFIFMQTKWEEEGENEWE